MPAILGSGLVLAAHSAPGGAGLILGPSVGRRRAVPGTWEGGRSVSPAQPGRWAGGSLAPGWVGPEVCGSREVFDQNLEQELSLTVLETRRKWAVMAELMESSEGGHCTRYHLGLPGQGGEVWALEPCRLPLILAL